MSRQPIQDPEPADSNIESARDLSFFLNAIPRWYPGTWLPPGEMVTVGSFLVGTLVAAYIFADPTRRALFRFPTSSLSSPLDLYYLLIPIVTSVIAWFIYGKVVQRPGPVYPRWYALLLAVVCSGIALGGLADRFAIKSYRGNPWVHAASAAALMSVLVLAIRLVKVHPYSQLVQQVVPITAAILVLGIVGARFLANSMISEERARVRSSAFRLHRLADEIRSATAYNWESLRDNPSGAARQADRLKSIQLGPTLPDEWVWKAAGILGPDTLGPLTVEAGGLAEAVADAIAKEAGPRIAGTEYVALDKHRVFTENADFHKTAPVAVEYYTQIKRMMQELEGSLPSSPARSLLETQRNRYDDVARKFRSSFSGHWLASAAKDDQDKLSPSDIAKTTLGGIPLADFAAWKALPWSTASKWRAQDRQAKPEAGVPIEACADDSVDYDEPAPSYWVKPDLDDSKTWIEYKQRYYFSRIDCYSYMDMDEGPGTVAQLQLLYRSDPAGKPKIGDNKTPLQVDLYWKQSGGKPDPATLMSFLASATKSQYNIQAKPISSGDTITKGFRVNARPGVSFDVTQPTPADGPAGRNLLHVAVK